MRRNGNTTAGKDWLLGALEDGNTIGDRTIYRARAQNKPYGSIKDDRGFKFEACEIMVSPVSRLLLNMVEITQTSQEYALDCVDCYAADNQHRHVGDYCWAMNWRR